MPGAIEVGNVGNEYFVLMVTKGKDMDNGEIREGYLDILGPVDIKEGKEDVLGFMKNPYGG